jgi:hypothetical protein
VLNAQTRNGDMENDFGLTSGNQSDNETRTLRGTVGAGGPTVTIATSDGDITVRKSTVAPLPAVPPAPPGIAAAPYPPSPPLPPGTPAPPQTHKPLRRYSF